MSRRDLLPSVFCPIGDGSKAPHPPRPRTRGRRVTTPTDAEVITTEPVGEFRGLGADEALYRHSRACHAAGFPDLARVCRTTSARRAADPRAVERAPHRRPAEGLPAGRSVRPVDGFPPPARRFARATSGARLAGEAGHGYDHRIERTFGAFSRTFTLPNTVDVEHITAESKDGVLRVFLPKKAETKPRQIKVGVSSPGTKH